MTIAENLTNAIFYFTKYLNSQNRHMYTGNQQWKPKKILLFPAKKGTYGFKWTGKGPRPAWTCRGVRRNKEFNRVAAYA
jgi:hypothetical protein